MTKREQELELEVWKSRMQTVHATVDALNMKGRLLQIEAKECQDNIKRLEDLLKPEDAQPAPLKAVE